MSRLIVSVVLLLFSIQSYAGDFVAVAKHAGGLHCSDSPGIKLEKMKEELNPILVLRMARKTTKDTQITLCGHPDSWFNVYWIKQVDLRHAQLRGFTVFKTSVPVRSKIVSL